MGMTTDLSWDGAAEEWERLMDTLVDLAWGVEEDEWNGKDMLI